MIGLFVDVGHPRGGFVDVLIDEDRPSRHERSEWHAATHRHPVGSEVTAEITDIFATTREYLVTFDGRWSAVFWTGIPPIVGTTAQFIVDRHLDATRRIRLRHRSVRGQVVTIGACSSATDSSGSSEELSVISRAWPSNR
ncbi:hypothetical protein B7C42_06235 [Nocardia cerradoensis]|uniref:S1 motif domain-containing protein n=1 Tax=Nocardia cerradoensis TaxID=85688 RepID=A0A231GY98_9NOCA|nr:hypothetical protein B7C42_06235 [Nocardia cerradoensis]